MTACRPAPPSAARSVPCALLVLLAACTSSVDGGGPHPLIVTLGGSNQWAPPSSALPGEIGVLLVRGGAPQVGVPVRFTTAAGTITPSVVTTGPNGVAAAVWTLPAGATPRAVQAVAEVDFTDAPEMQFTAFVVPAGNAVVTVSNNVFSPVPRTIAAGQTVTWIWFDGAVGHNVTPLGLEPVASGALRNGPFVYSYAFPTSGNYTFYCEAHGTPLGTGMAGVITVQPPG